MINPVQHYAWGSSSDIPCLLGVQGGNEPWAELWMGAHPASPSQVDLPSGAAGLDRLIAADPVYCLGERAAGKYGALPFLFKLLAAGKPLSIQAHPNLAQAKEGFERENKANIAIDASSRNYKDPNHKPEIICALTPFTGLCGFRPPAEIRRMLEAFLKQAPAVIKDGFARMMNLLKNTPRGGMPAQREEESLLENFFVELFNLSQDVREALTEYILSLNSSSSSPEINSSEMDLMTQFAELYPNDPAVIAPLYLNVFRLEPGEAVFLKAGILHAYCSGFGVELMANSDNVLRGGLTAKHIDIPELVHVLDFSPFAPRIIKPAQGASRFTYADEGTSGCEEFSLSVLYGSSGGAGNDLSVFAAKGPAIAIVTEGEAIIADTVLKQGESVFIPAADAGPLPLKGNYTIYAASLPK